MNGRRVRRPGRPQVGGSYEPVARPVSGPPKQRSRRWLAKLIMFGLTAIILVSAFWFLGRVSAIDVQGSLDPEAIASQTDGLISQPFWRSHLYWLNTEEVATELLEANAATIAAVAVEKNWLSRTLVVRVDERRPTIIWQTQGKDFQADQTGVIMAEGRGEAANLPQVIDMSNLDAKIGQAVAPGRFIGFVLEVRDKITPQIGLNFNQARIVDTTSELYIDTSGGFYIRFDSARSVDEQLLEVKTILNNNIRPSQYIDVRLPYKAYYK